MVTPLMIAVVKIFFLFVLSFLVTIALTPVLTHFLYKYKLGKSIRDDMEKTPVYSKLHKHKEGTPTMGGILIWGVTLLLALAFGGISWIWPEAPLAELNFLTRSETWLPLGVLVASAVVGMVDDLFNVKKRGAVGGGLRLRHRLLLFSIIGLVAALWFYFKLDWTIVHVPFVGTFDLAWWSIPFYLLVIVATSFSVNNTDGLDGLAGGVLLTCFSTMATIAFLQGRFNLTTFCVVIAGALLAFLWFNIHPARFFMGDTGSMPLGVTLALVAILTNTVWLLPIIGLILVVESGSIIVQMTSKKLRNGKKIFRSTPIHHHFEAIGWEEPKIVMRFWIVSAVVGVFGMVFYLVDKALLA